MLNKLFNQKIITIGKKEYKLRKVTAKELFKYRLGDKPGLVFKNEHELWYTQLLNTSVKFKGAEKNAYRHMCSRDDSCCQRLSAAPDPIGCACMRDISFGSCRTSKHRVFLCDTCLRIEKYPFIEVAIETFNMEIDALKVIRCTNCVMTDGKGKKMKSKDYDRAVLALAQNLNPDLEDISDAFSYPEVND